MRAGATLSIPDAVSARQGEREYVQPGLPGTWSVWSAAGVSPGAHFVVPVDAVARATGVKWATVRITEPAGEDVRVQLLATDPPEKMPKERRVRS